MLEFEFHLGCHVDIHLTICIFHCDLHKIRLESALPERDYCQRRGASLSVQNHHEETRQDIVDRGTSQTASPALNGSRTRDPSNEECLRPNGH